MPARVQGVASNASRRRRVINQLGGLFLLRARGVKPVRVRVEELGTLPRLVENNEVRQYLRCGIRESASTIPERTRIGSACVRGRVLKFARVNWARFIAPRERVSWSVINHARQDQLENRVRG